MSKVSQEAVFVDGRNSLHQGIFFNCTFDGNSDDKWIPQEWWNRKLDLPSTYQLPLQNFTGAAISIGDSRSIGVKSNVISNAVSGIVLDADTNHRYYRVKRLV